MTALVLDNISINFGGVHAVSDVNLTLFQGDLRFLQAPAILSQFLQAKVFDRVPGLDVVMVEVVNSTPEPDGTSRTYWLRVPPATRTAREGVAWTFGVGAEIYEPLQQT